MLRESISLASQPLWPELDSFTTERLDALREAFRKSGPARHLVLDGLFPDTLLNSIVDEFALVRQDQWRECRNLLQQKRATATSPELPPSSRAYTDFVHSGVFQRFLEYVTGIDDLVADPTLFGGGLHEISTGGAFELHRDFPRHPVTKLANQLIVITYLNHGWCEEYGSALELWSHSPRKLEKSILPVFGRTVIMETSGTSLHGHPNAVRAPDGQPRRSIACYFYKDLAQDKSRFSLDSTVYVARPGQSMAQKGVVALYKLLPAPAINLLKQLVISKSSHAETPNDRKIEAPKA